MTAVHFSVHDVAAGVSIEVLFHHLFHNPANDGDQVGKSSGIHDRFHELVVRHGFFEEQI